MPKSSFYSFVPEEYADKSKMALWIKLIDAA